ncbi:MAG: AIR synthase-related protein [Mediterraneibacter sp.]
MLQAAGNLAARGVTPQGVSLRILFPEETEEEMLAAAARGAQEVCGRMGTELTCLQGEVNPAVRRMVVLADAAGAADSGEFTGIMRPGQEILLCGYTGLEGMLHILDEAEEELAERFVPLFLGQARALQSDLVMPEQILAGCRAEASGGGRLISAARQIGSGGILAALWEMAEISGTGLEVSMEAMALKQETVEICEYFQINPYQMTSAGSYLIATEHAEELMGVLEKAGARAGRLGIARAQNARVITSGDETRYLDRPAPDSLMCWQQDRPFGNKAGKSIS